MCIYLHMHINFTVIIDFTFRLFSLLQGYLQNIRLEPLYVFYTGCFLIFTVFGNCKLVSFLPTHEISQYNSTVQQNNTILGSRLGIVILHEF